MYICPICDQTMKSKHYCRGCRQFIKTPFEREVDYYLNERHPDAEQHCEYHGISTAGRIAREAFRKGTEKRERRPADSGELAQHARMSGRPMEKPRPVRPSVSSAEPGESPQTSLTGQLRQLERMGRQAQGAVRNYAKDMFSLDKNQGTKGKKDPNPFSLLGTIVTVILAILALLT